jgi:hypothetical protein
LIGQIYRYMSKINGIIYYWRSSVRNALFPNQIYLVAYRGNFFYSTLISYSLKILFCQRLNSFRSKHSIFVLNCNIDRKSRSYIKRLLCKRFEWYLAAESSYDCRVRTITVVKVLTVQGVTVLDLNDVACNIMGSPRNGQGLVWYACLWWLRIYFFF